jgi:uncharacterized protein
VIGRLLFSGSDLQPDRPRALSYLERGCALGSTDACIAHEARRPHAPPPVAPGEGSGPGIGLGRFGTVGRGFGAAEPQAPAAFVLAARRAGCDRGSGDDCWRLGQAIAAGDGAARDLPMAEAAFERGCLLGAVWSCDELVRTANTRRARELERRACLGGDGETCVALGDRLAAEERERGDQRPDGAGPGSAQAVRAFEWACLSGYDDGCRKLLDLHETRGVGEDLERTARLLGRACDIGSAVACALLGERTLRGRGVLEDHARAAALLKKGCYLGHQGCAALRAEPLVATMIARFEDDCRGGLPEGCEQLAEALSDGKMLPKDLDRATRLRERACEGEVATACEALARRYDQGEGVTIDMARAASYDERACELGRTVSCLRLAVWYADGRGVAKSEKRAAELRARACEQGHEPSCGRR